MPEDKRREVERREVQEGPGLSLDALAEDPHDEEWKALKVLQTMIDGKRVYLEDSK